MKKGTIRSVLLMAGAAIAVMVAVVVLSASAQTTKGSLQETADTGDPTGRWITASGNLEVEIAACDQALCGTVTRVISNQSMSGEAAAPADSRPALGMKILEDFVSSGENKWKGHIYNRDNGKTYDCVMTVVAPDQLSLRAYKFLTLFGKTQIWRRVSDPSKGTP